VYTQCASSQRKFRIVPRRSSPVCSQVFIEAVIIPIAISRPVLARIDSGAERINDARLSRSRNLSPLSQFGRRSYRDIATTNLIWQGLISLDMASPRNDTSLLGDRYSIPSCFRSRAIFTEPTPADGSSKLKKGPRIVSAARIDESSKGRRSRTLGLRTIPDHAVDVEYRHACYNRSLSNIINHISHFENFIEQVSILSERRGRSFSLLHRCSSTFLSPCNLPLSPFVFPVIALSPSCDTDATKPNQRPRDRISQVAIVLRMLLF